MNSPAQRLVVAQEQYGILTGLFATLILIVLFAVPLMRPQTHNRIPEAGSALPERGSHPLLGIEYSGNHLLIVDGRAELVYPDELGARLRALYDGRTDRVLFLSAAPDTPYADIMAIVEAARTARVGRISLLASCPPGKESLLEQCHT